MTILELTDPDWCMLLLSLGLAAGATSQESPQLSHSIIELAKRLEQQAREQRGHD